MYLQSERINRNQVDAWGDLDLYRLVQLPIVDRVVGEVYSAVALNINAAADNAKQLA